MAIREHGRDFMNELVEDMMRIVLIGVGATAVMDAWLWLLKRMNVPALNFAFLGRWVGHWRQGKWKHDSMAKAAPVKRELALGWLVHYLTGIVFAGLLVCIYGLAWTRSPGLLPALSVGVGTVVVPLLVMQPAMGAGIASSRTPTPIRNCLRSVANHTVFGFGLYLAAVFIAWISR
jgi:hypothetical protein